MATVEEYVSMAEEAKKNSAHVAVLTYYRNAVELAGYSPNAADILLVAVKYAQGLKKAQDKAAIAEWSKVTLEKLRALSLDQIARTEIAKLQAGGGKNATT